MSDRQQSPIPSANERACDAARAEPIPRDRWSAHPNYPSQLLLLGSHANFRAANESLRLQVTRGADLAFAASFWRRFISAMRSHESYEERKLYPYLARRWGVSFDEAQAGHEALHDADDAVRAAFDAEDRSAVIRALVRHGAVLDAHLELEEELVIPLLLQLSPEEFERYANSHVYTLMRDLDARDEEREAACAGGACT